MSVGSVNPFFRNAAAGSAYKQQQPKPQAEAQVLAAHTNPFLFRGITSAQKPESNSSRPVTSANNHFAGINNQLTNPSMANGAWLQGRRVNHLANA